MAKRKKGQQSTQITKRSEPPLKPGVNLDVEEEYSSCSTSGSRCSTVKRHKNHLRSKSCLLNQILLLAKYLFSQSEQYYF